MCKCLCDPWTWNLSVNNRSGAAVSCGRSIRFLGNLQTGIPTLYFIFTFVPEVYKGPFLSTFYNWDDIEVQCSFHYVSLVVSEVELFFP